MGMLFVGAGFASVYPLVVEKMAHRFPEYQRRPVQRHLFVGGHGRFAGAVAARLRCRRLGASGR